jgi:flagellin
MSVRINQNMAAANAHRYLAANDANMSKSIERLSSGLRINTAADDAAGLVISENLRTQVSGLGQALKNAQDGINMIKTTESALNELEIQLRSMRDLTLHAANANGNVQMLAADQAQLTQAISSIDRISQQTEFAGKALLGGATGTATIDNALFQIGANGGQTAQFIIGGVSYDGVTLSANMSAVSLGVSAGGSGTTAKVTASTAMAATMTANENLTITGADGSAVVALTAGDDRATVLAAINAETANTGVVASLTKADGSVGSAAENIYLTLTSSAAGADQTVSAMSNLAAAGQSGVGTTAVTATGIGGAAGGIDLTDAAANYTTILNTIDDAMKMVNGLRVNLGAFQKNNLESNLNSLAVTKENLSASESAIRDTDMAEEMVTFTKSQILTQAAQAMLTQANQAPQNILQMLR